MVLAWGTNFAVVKIAGQSFTPPALSLLRFLGMWPLLIGVMAAMKLPLSFPPGRERTRVIFSGFLASGLYMVLFLEGMARSSAAQGAITLATAPIFIALFSVMAKQEVFRARLLVGSLIALAGVATVVLAGHGSGTGGTVMGSVLILLSAIVWAWSVVVMRPLLASWSPVSVLTWSFSGAALALIPYGAVALWRQDWGAVTVSGWLALGYLVVVAGVLAFIAYYKGLADVGPNQTSMTQFFIAPTAAFTGWILLGQAMNVIQILGLAVVIVGVFIASRKTPVATETPAEGGLSGVIAAKAAADAQES